jgi:4-hydroxybenzoate polyprenyltransferase
MPSLKAYLQLARPQQYVKNGFVLFPVLFGHKFLEPPALGHALAAFAAFCLAAQQRLRVQ